MDFDKVKLSLYKYKVKSFQFIIGKDSKYEIVNNMIINFSIVSDYEKYYFPYFEMTLSVPNATHRLMKKNANNIKANLTLYKGKFKEMLSAGSTSTPSFKKAFSTTFFVFMDDSTPDVTEDEQKLVEKSSNKYGQLSTIKILLYPYSYYNKYDLIVNDNLENVTLVEALTYLCNRVKVTNVLLSPPSNYKTYKQFTLTPIPFVNQVDRICNTYALHKKGTIIFFDFDRFYIIDKTPKCTAYTNNEYKITYIMTDTKSSTTRDEGGACADKTNKFNVLNASDVKFKNDKELTKKTLGSNVVSVNANGKVTKTNKKATKVTRVLVQNEGDSTAKSLKRAMSESKRVLTAQFKDTDIAMFTPNKQFIVTMNGANYKKYNGKYRLSKVVHSFSKEGDYYQMISSAEFKG